MEELSTICMNKNNNEEKIVYIKSIGNFSKKIKFDDDCRINEVLKKNNLLNDNDTHLYQIKNKLIDLDKTFSYYNVNDGDIIYILPSPSPLPYLIYLFHQKTGRVHCIELNHEDSVNSLHKKVEKILKIKEEDQILIYSGKCLQNKKTLKEEKLARESLVTILNKKDIPEIDNEN
ncbi:ubiquitin-like protein, putative [Plasmodium gallinaceum]|uniref:Ubiquitin-like protein, putative n=1 Tax=Plasmodium gallinaceum TaxID=5849 RepID=A0A1J1GY99_PLAGA|nr:ubiquitin-like protein, putative [Plasmodium gallinaceum]CRG97538.1 ubiquitin-like protein, putative [Plasmodium gallinaceum]